MIQFIIIKDVLIIVKLQLCQIIFWNVAVLHEARGTSRQRICWPRCIISRPYYFPDFFLLNVDFRVWVHMFSPHYFKLFYSNVIADHRSDF